MSDYPKYLKWGDYKSQDKDNPDVIHVEVTDPEPYRTTYDWHFNGYVGIEEKHIPLRGTTITQQPYGQYLQLLHEGNVTVGTKLVIKTWLRQSTRNRENQIREFEIKVSS